MTRLVNKKQVNRCVRKQLFWEGVQQQKKIAKKTLNHFFQRTITIKKPQFARGFDKSLAE